MKPTVSLQMIIKDEVEAVGALVMGAAAFMDKANITATTPKAYKRLADIFKDTPDVKISYFEWVDDFAAARNFNLQQCETDYFFWLDADDEFDFSTIPELVRIAMHDSYDVIYLPYNYAQDEHGNTVTEHYRERLIRTGAGFEWRGVVHENLLRDTQFKAKKLDSPIVIHHAGNPEVSRIRNHKILLKQVEGKELAEVDPRDLHYLGISHFAMGEYKSAIQRLLEYVDVGGWDEEIYRSYIKISESFFMLNMLAEAQQYALQAAGYMPHYPDAYFTLARYEYANSNWPETLEWIEVAFSKPKPKTMSVQNPQVYDLAKLQAATAMFQLKQYAKAYKYLETVPDYLAAEIRDQFKAEANKQTFVDMVPQLIESGFIAGDIDFYNALTDDMKFDGRLKWLRNRVVPPKSWDAKTIVFYCGAGYEEWGAHTLSKGMGGSEEAVVYLSREFAKAGYNVTVFNSVKEPILDQFDPAVHEWVRYLPYKEFDPRDSFDTLVCWRQPDISDKLQARVKIIDMHDVLPAEVVPAHDDATYFVKSQWQRNLYPDMPDDQFHVIGNGIVAKQFEGVAKNKGNQSWVGYFSSYYRGLECLIDMWPEIRKQAIAAGLKPEDVQLHICYGWGSYTAFQGEDAFYHRMNDKLAAVGAIYEGAEYPKDVEFQGVIMHDRVSHENLATIMGLTQVWAYPTQFPETHCITALKAQEALCYPVTTTVAALAETVQSGVQLDTEIIYSNQYEQRKFIKAVVDGLVEKKTGTPVEGADWSYVAADWINFIEGK